MKRSPTNAFVMIFFVTVTYLVPFLWKGVEFSVVWAKDDNRAVPVEVINPQRRSIEEYVKITGTCHSSERSTIGAKIEGTIENFLVDEGDRVKKGQVLARLEKTDYAFKLKLAELEYLNAKAQVEKGKAEIEKASSDLITKKADFERLRTVYEKGSLAKQRFDLAKNSYDVAQVVLNQTKIGLKIFETQVIFLKTRVEIARKKLLDCKIRAPFHGVISIRHANIGEWVKVGESIFTLEADNPIEIKGRISEIYLNKLKIGMPVRVKVDGANSPSGTSRDYEPKLKEIAPVADPRQRTVEITVQMNNADYLLKPGLFARMDVILKRTAEAMVIPEACIIKAHNPLSVFVIKENRAEIQEIETGIKEAEMVEILSGLNMDSKVVAAGKDQLVGGEKVLIQKRRTQ